MASPDLPNAFSARRCYRKGIAPTNWMRRTSPARWMPRCAAVLDDLDEALVNAVAHRDYSIDGAKIRLRMFADRLELYSPGAIPNTMTVDSLPYRQAARNEALTSLLAKCPVSESEHAFTGRSALMDKRGEGVQIILDNSERLSGKRPVYSLLDESELRLVIPALQA